MSEKDKKEEERQKEMDALISEKEREEKMKEFHLQAGLKQRQEFLDEQKAKNEALIQSTLKAKEVKRLLKLVKPEPIIWPKPKPKIEILTEQLISSNKKIKALFPKLTFLDDSECIQSTKKNPRCNTCMRLFTQSSLLDVKEKMHDRYSGKNQTLLFRIYKNSNEKLEASKDYCVFQIREGRHTRELIPLPEMSLCSDWRLHPNIETHFGFLTHFLGEKKRLEQEKESKKRAKLEEIRKAKEVIANHNREKEISIQN